MSISPNADQITQYVQSDLDGEVVMLNLLKFKTTGASSEESGKESYGRYGVAVKKMVEKQEGKVLWVGEARHVFVGDVDTNGWDAVALVSYPSRQAFLEMVSKPEYSEIHTDREGGLADTIVIACAPAAGFGSSER